MKKNLLLSISTFFVLTACSNVNEASLDIETTTNTTITTTTSIFETQTTETSITPEMSTEGQTTYIGSDDKVYGKLLSDGKQNTGGTLYI